MGYAPEEEILFKFSIEIIWYRDITESDFHSNIWSHLIYIFSNAKESLHYSRAYTLPDSVLLFNNNYTVFKHNLILAWYSLHRAWFFLEFFF